MTAQRIIVGAAASHDIYVYVDGTLTDLDAEPTYTITDAAGSAAGSGTASSVSTGIYRITVSGQSEVDQWTVVWSGDLSSNPWEATTYIEFVGGHLFTEAELRAFNDSDLASEVNYPDSAILDVRATVTDQFETICGVSFIERWRNQTLAGTGDYTIDLDRPQVNNIITATISGTEVAASSFVIDNTARMLHRTNGIFTPPTTGNPLNVSVSYRHGYTAVPGDIRDAALTVAHATLVGKIEGTGVPARASSWTDSTGTFQAFAPNNTTQRWFGMPTVDNTLRRYMAWPVLL